MPTLYQVSCVPCHLSVLRCLGLQIIKKLKFVECTLGARYQGQCFMYISCYLQQQNEYSGNLGPGRRLVLKVPQVRSGRGGIRSHIFHSKACALSIPPLFHLICTMGTYHLYFLRLLPGAETISAVTLLSAAGIL